MQYFIGISGGYWRKSKSNFQGSIKNEQQHGISRGDQIKIIEFLGVLVLGLKISEGCNTGVSRGEALICVEFPGVKYFNCKPTF